VLFIDHKASSEEERERITNEGGELTSGQTRVMGGLAVSRALGDHFLKKEKVGLIADPFVCSPIEISANDTTVILASDGVKFKSDKNINFVR
jgi:protein phosphatase